MTTAQWVLRRISQTTKIKGPLLLPDQSQMSKTYLPEMSCQNTKKHLAVKSAGQKAEDSDRQYSKCAHMQNIAKQHDTFSFL
jgi:hypothetical protein